jgi:hypothetical protein
MNEIKKLQPCYADWLKNVGKFFNDRFIIINLTPIKNFLQYCVWRKPMIAILRKINFHNITPYKWWFFGNWPG